MPWIEPPVDGDRIIGLKASVDRTELDVGVEITRELDDDRSVSQLCALERQTTRSGRDSVSHPPGAFDDLINAIAGAAAHVPAAAKRDWKRYQ